MKYIEEAKELLNETAFAINTYPSDNTASIQNFVSENEEQFFFLCIRMIEFNSGNFTFSLFNTSFCAEGNYIEIDKDKLHLEATVAINVFYANAETLKEFLTVFTHIQYLNCIGEAKKMA